ncbi:MAG: hypothetical protein LBR00_07070 [Clostridiales Family XIII bacterium]|nr:hypothetical protein [Clostridiales Family XIII bacterium]
MKVWDCPHCGDSFTEAEYGGGPPYCPYCGELMWGPGEDGRPTTAGSKGFGSAQPRTSKGVAPAATGCSAMIGVLAALVFLIVIAVAI